ncbi:hypothetical protein MMC15_001863 [Xylographa vitiligo]|nr:hypothetical protein [Xylographa vitiligo]
MTRTNQNLNRQKKEARLARKAAISGSSIGIDHFQHSDMSIRQPYMGETSYDRRQSRTEAFALLEPSRVHNRTLVNSLLREGRISAATATAIKNRFCAPHQALRLVASQALKVMGEPLEGDTPYQKMTEEEVLAEDAARRGRGKAVLVEKEGAEGPIEYDEESEWERAIPVPGDEMDEEVEDLWAE